MSVDVLPTAAADLVAEAEALPFRDNTFDRVVSGAVFEHVYDPIRSAKEVRRVIKDGGSFYIDTAFLQGYHGFPNHYFNMTSQAVETYLVDGFSLIYSGVGDNETVGYTLQELLRRFRDSLPTDKAAILSDMSIGQLIKEFEADSSRKNRFINTLSEFSHRALAAGVVVIAQKPRGYSESIGHPEREPEAAMLRDYYTARMSVIQRHHEVEASRRKAIDRHPELADAEGPPSLDGILFVGGRPPEMCSFQEATVALKRQNEALTIMRDKWRAPKGDIGATSTCLRDDRGDHSGSTDMLATALDILIFSHDLSESGAPRGAFEVARTLRNAGHFVVVASPSDGPYRERLRNIGVDVVIDEVLLNQDLNVFDFAKNFDKVICNTIVCWPLVAQLSDVVDLYWYVHESEGISHFAENVPGFTAALKKGVPIWADSRLAAKYLKMHGVEPYVIEYGVDDPVSLRLSSRCDAEKVVIGIFGSYERRKGQDLAIGGMLSLTGEMRSSGGTEAVRAHLGRGLS